MRKNAKIFAVLLAAICLCVLCLAACAPDDRHQHTYAFKQEVPATCTAAGYEEYFCTGCLEKKQVKTEAPLGHNFRAKTCKFPHRMLK